MLRGVVRLEYWRIQQRNFGGRHAHDDLEDSQQPLALLGGRPPAVAEDIAHQNARRNHQPLVVLGGRPAVVAQDIE